MVENSWVSYYYVYKIYTEVCLLVYVVSWFLSGDIYCDEKIISLNLFGFELQFYNW